MGRNATLDLLALAKDAILLKNPPVAVIRGVALALLVSCGVAQAGTALRPLQDAQTHATATAATAGVSFKTLQRAVSARFADIKTAERLLMGARSATGFDDQRLAAAVDALARAKAAYDATVRREKEAAVSWLQAEAEARTARQVLTDAVTEWTAESDALERAAVRAAVGEVAPAAREHTACLAEVCAPVSAREHAALVAIGAIGPDFDAREWPADAARDITLLAAPVKPPVRDMRSSAALAAKLAQETRDTVTARRAPLATALSEWDRALQDLQEAYSRKKGGGHDGETLSMAVASYDAAVMKLDPFTGAYREASIAADIAAAGKAPAEARLAERLTFYGDAARATRRAALLAARGAALTTAANGLAVCLDKICAPASGLEAAAFVVVGAATGDAGKTLATLVTTTPDGRRAFKVP